MTHNEGLAPVFRKLLMDELTEAWEHPPSAYYVSMVSDELLEGIKEWKEMQRSSLR